MLAKNTFNPNLDKTVKCAELVNGEVVYLEKPRYHLNPTGRNSLVTYRYGWDILDFAHEAGFETVYFEKTYSPKTGNVGANLLFTLIAIKS